jgi:hypothetical protein
MIVPAVWKLAKGPNSTAQCGADMASRNRAAVTQARINATKVTDRPTELPINQRM